MLVIAEAVAHPVYIFRFGKLIFLTFLGIGVNMQKSSESPIMRDGAIAEFTFVNSLKEISGLIKKKHMWATLHNILKKTNELGARNIESIGNV